MSFGIIMSIDNLIMEILLLFWMFLGFVIMEDSSYGFNESRFVMIKDNFKLFDLSIVDNFCENWGRESEYVVFLVDECEESLE